MKLLLNNANSNFNSQNNIDSASFKERYFSGNYEVIIEDIRTAELILLFLGKY